MDKTIDNYNKAIDDILLNRDPERYKELIEDARKIDEENFKRAHEHGVISSWGLIPFLKALNRFQYPFM